MKNEYEVRGDVTAIIINSPKYGRHETLISTSKLDRAKEFPSSWHLYWSKCTDSFYVQGNMKQVNGIGKTTRLHRWITNAPIDMQVDHIDHLTLNNVDSNLRILTQRENLQNRKGAQTNSKSGVRGVSWREDRKKWRAHITINQVFKHIGSFDTIEEAEQAVIDARMHHMPYSQGASL